MKRIPGLAKVRDIHSLVSPDLVSLVKAMGAGGGFQSKNLADAAEVLHSMYSKEDCTKFLSFPAAIVATGTRGVLIDLVREGMVDAIITASGTLDHDISRTLSDYYHGSFDMDDVALSKAGYHRLGNVLVPVASYGPLIEKRMQGLLSKMHARGATAPTTEELCREIGRDLDSEKSLLYWAQKKGVPVFVPGIMDGSVGSQLWLFAEKHRDFKVDIIGDERRLAEIVFASKKSGALVIGGGITKHHAIWWNQFRGGLDYVCYITTAVEYDGSLSGAQVREAISWGKVRAKAKKVNLYADATTVLPLLVSYALTMREKDSVRT
ncbi:MAG: deoxyhypusine synthase [Nitrososphaerales archaeon]